MSGETCEGDSNSFDVSGGGKIHAISIGVNLGAFTILTVFTSAWLYFGLLYLYLLEGRYAGYLPTISETGTQRPCDIAESRAFATICTVSFFADILVMYYAQTYSGLTSLARFSKLVMPIGILGVLITGACDLSLHLWPHRVFAFTGLFCVSVFEFTVLALAWNGMGPLGKTIRFGLLFIEAIAFVNAAFAELMYSPRACITISTWAEYVYVTMVTGFLSSFYGELNASSLDVFWVDDKCGAMAESELGKIMNE
jgi:hypothetical protein